MRKRNIRISVRLTEQEYQHLKLQTGVSGLKFEPFIRALIMNKTVRAGPPNEYTELLRELSAIGNNINQIARVANGNRHVSPAQIEKIIEMQGDIWFRVKGL